MANTQVIYDYGTHRLKTSENNLDGLLQNLTSPLSVILQITRRCHFNCKFCSEKDMLPDPSLAELTQFENHLKGVQRIFLSGGEPLLRSDFTEVANIFKNHILGLPTNALASEKHIETIKNFNISVNIGLDGPRAVTSKIRGDYDFIMEGIRTLIKNDIQFSLTAVVLRSTADSILYTCQIADTLGAKKLKFVLPIPKGNALNLDQKEFISEKEAQNLCEQIRNAKNKYGWKTVYTFSIWNKQTDGYSILVYPNGKTYAWPVITEPSKVLLLGDLHVDTIQEIWNRYPYKHNHINKYLGNGIQII